MNLFSIVSMNAPLQRRWSPRSPIYQVPKASEETQSGFILMDKGLLFDFLSSNMRCEVCNHYSVTCTLDAKCGFSHDIVLKRKHCEEWEVKFKTTNEVLTAIWRLISGWLLLLDLSGEDTVLCRTFQCIWIIKIPWLTGINWKFFNKIHLASREVATDSMNAAARELRSFDSADPCTNENHERYSGVSQPIDQEENISTNCTVSLDGTWQRRGHASHHGVVTPISVQTGKCVDTEVLSNISAKSVSTVRTKRRRQNISHCVFMFNLLFVLSVE